MTELAIVREALAGPFQNITEIEDGVVRGERVYDDKRYASAYIDFGDDVVGRSRELRSFQERIIGVDYFDLPEQLRWSNYLYVLAGPKSLKAEGFAEAKATIEANRDYARKFVLTADDMLAVLGDSLLFKHDHDVETEDVTTRWAAHLTTHQLNALLDKPKPRTKAIELIEKGQGSRTFAKSKANELSAKDVKLTDGFLRSLTVSAFRPVHDGNSYVFADVNLIVGPNGSGKTSLLEAIEYLYCGHNRRDGTRRGYRLSGQVESALRDQLEPISATTDANRLKSRNLAWYRKDDHKSRSILDGFTRYNFLDTDAAYRVSTALEPKELNEDLRRLLVGSDASTLWDYLEKVSEDVESRTKELRREVTVEADRNETLKKELERITLAPSQASSLSKSFRAALREIGWKGKEALEDEPVNETERAGLESVAGVLKRLGAATSVRPVSKTALLNRLDLLEPLHDTARTLEQQRAQMASDLSRKTRELALVVKNLELLAEWFAYCGADAPKLIRAVSGGRSSVRDAQLQFGAIASTSVPQLPDEYASLALPDVARRVASAVTSTRGEVLTAELAQRNIQSLQQSLALLRRQLQDAARQLVAQAGMEGSCPVCSVSHPPEVLRLKIEALSSDGELPEVTELAQRLKEAKSREAGSLKVQKDVELLQKLANSLRLNPKTATAKEVRDTLVRIQQSLQLAVASLRQAEEAVAAFDSIGISTQRYAELRPLITALFKVGDDIESLDLIEGAKKEFFSKAEMLRKEASELEVVIKTVSANLLPLQRRALLNSETSANLNLDASVVFKTLDAELEQTKRAITLVEKVGQFVEFSADRSILDLDGGIASATEAFDRALHAMKSELQANQAKTKATRDYHESSASLKSKRGQLQRLKDANNALTVLRTDYSLDSSTDKVLEAIRDQINDVFGRIHAPREYQFSNWKDPILVTRIGNKPRSLEQVSTGQRAAFALSIFLALNSTARTAPPVVLIDDPVAHVDDLNVLSFLDYLRDLVLHSRRQIFFATADTRVAALFDKKFSFLGPNRYKRVPMPPRANP